VHLAGLTAIDAGENLRTGIIQVKHLTVGSWLAGPTQPPSVKVSVRSHR